VFRVNLAAGGTATGVAVAVALLVGAIPAQSAPSAASGVAGPTSTGTGTPTPTGTPSQTPAPTTTTPDDRLLPDLVALPAGKAYVQRRSDGRRLRFESALGNVGDGPIEVRPNNARPCPAGQHNSTQIIYRDANSNARYNLRKDTSFVRHRAGCMVFHPAHDHWHFKASARYTLLKPAKERRVVVSARRKVSFCLRDSDRLPRRYGTWDHRESYGRCSQRSPQGISVGWKDGYQNFLAGQALRLARRLTPGLYCLETVVDPIDQLAESDDTNNSSVRALRINGDRVKVRPAARCTRQEGTS
jgi:hypothetical protein